jgi:hypothetical protein
MYQPSGEQLKEPTRNYSSIIAAAANQQVTDSSAGLEAFDYAFLV